MGRLALKGSYTESRGKMGKKEKVEITSQNMNSVNLPVIILAALPKQVKKPSFPGIHKIKRTLKF